MPLLANHLFEAAVRAGCAPGWRHAEVARREQQVASWESRLEVRVAEFDEHQKGYLPRIYLG